MSVYKTAAIFVRLGGHLSLIDIVQNRSNGFYLAIMYVKN